MNKSYSYSFNSFLGVFFLSFFFSFLFVANPTQAQQSLEELNRHMLSLRDDSDTRVPDAVLRDQENALALLNALSPFLNDSVERLRSEAYSLHRRIGQQHPQQTVRRKAVESLVVGLQDAASGIVGNNASGLRYFQPGDFSPETRESLLTSLTPGVPHKGAIAKLIGYLQMQEAKESLYALLREGKLGRTDQWSIYLALARLGDAQALSHTVTRIKRLPMNDDVVYDILPDLVYIRHPEAMAYLVEVLYSNEKSCESADADLGGNILCAYRVMEMMAPVIKDFPLAVGSSGDLETDDYQEALLQVRKWFDAHPDYEIVQNTF